ncbi:aminotransferase class V-fold PLP-dependent enzyme [Tuberibacillus sp. Marseille-P3662]|uniref:aminotransferase class V-fold PLP-dependent enzyme n=1 Tax=Tuberibacillus sp. Marseille-P3662 TaxID=1965358 RepID=UPI000A1C7D41|nr:aminotransferase class V-fold PLP-dependent enzyme [Tuberibacillus sp. Marseille-P3662]
MGSPVLKTMSFNEAKEKQFQLVNTITKEFDGGAFFNQGDLGVVPGIGKPEQTHKVEKVLAQFFQAESCALVRGAGTGAIRETLTSLLNPGDKLFMHSSPIYKTTKETIDMMGLTPVFVNYNDTDELRKALQENRDCHIFYAQHSRQKPDDSYELDEVIQHVHELNPELPIVIDDNYTVLKVNKIGTELGASYSCFSGFKLLGPPGIGIVVGDQAAVQAIDKRNYSGGGQVQGYEAMDLLRSLVTAPVMIAVQNEQTDRLNHLLNDGVISDVYQAYVTNSQSKNVIVELQEPIAEQVIAESEKYGAAIYPVGAESRFEVLPMIYRVSGSFLDDHPELVKTGIRINPMRSGADMIIDILIKAIADVHANERRD